jgi:antitoxin component of MazEF toxin-antitoxin module
MTAVLTNFGENIGVQFPKSLLKNVPISEKDDVEILIKNNSIIIKRKESRKHFTTKERIAYFCQTTEDVQFSEIDWGTPQGKEIW